MKRSSSNNGLGWPYRPHCPPAQGGRGTDVGEGFIKAGKDTPPDRGTSVLATGALC